jgi:hypothetical protein
MLKYSPTTDDDDGRSRVGYFYIFNTENKRLSKKNSTQNGGELYLCHECQKKEIYM